MPGTVLKQFRKDHALTQSEVARRLGVSQPYVALVEAGRRRMPRSLARKAVRVLGLSPTVVPPVAHAPQPVPAQRLAQDLAALGYPGFAYLRSGWRKNPVEVLLLALQQSDLESRVVEALPWLLLNYADLDQGWLVRQARLLNLSNRLGFVVGLALGVLERRRDTASAHYRALAGLRTELTRSRLDREDTLCQDALTLTEREWLRDYRSPEATYWHLLTDWRPEHLQYARP